MQAWSPQASRIHVLGAFALTVMAGLFAALPLELGTTALLFAPLVGAVYYLAAMRRYWRRRRVVRQPFPEAWRHRLESCVDFYGKLDAPEKGRFEQSVQIFLSEQRIYGVRGAEVPDEAKVLVAASAAMISHGLPEWEWPTIRDIVIYPSAFDEDYDAGRGKNIIGMVHAQGPILFSGPQLSHGFCVDRDGHNVGLHEMAHVLDMADGRADGIPAGVQWVSSAPWLSLVADRLRRVRRGQMRRILRGYAGKNEAEFFAVAVETFFEKPTQLADKDSELFEMLADYFNLDPRTAKLRRPLATARSDQ